MLGDIVEKSEVAKFGQLLIAVVVELWQPLFTDEQLLAVAVLVEEKASLALEKTNNIQNKCDKESV